MPPTADQALVTPASGARGQKRLRITVEQSDMGHCVD
jgi:hypothetical protein